VLVASSPAQFENPGVLKISLKRGLK